MTTFAATAGIQANGDVPFAQRAGLAGIVGGLVSAAAAVATAVWPTDVPATLLRHPFSVEAFRATLLLATAANVLMLIAVLGLVRSGIVGRGRLGIVGNRLAVMGMALIVPAQLGFVFIANSLDDSTESNSLGAAIGLATTLAAVGLILQGIAVLRDGAWTGWGRWTPLLAGAFVPLVLIPVQAVWPEGFLWPIAGWSACFVALGAALRR